MSRKISRRALLQVGLSSAALGLLSSCGGGATAPQGPITTQTSPAATVVPTVSPSPSPSPTPAPVVSVTLDAQMGTNIVDGKSFLSRTFNGLIGGPLIRVRPGDNLRILVNNKLPANPDPPPHDINIPHQFNSTNIHTHGLHVSPMGNSDNVFVDIEPGHSFQYSYQIPSNHPAGTYFYHPHKHGSSTMQLFSGMGGMLIVEGDIDQVPEVKAATEVPFYINELMQDATGQVPVWTNKGTFAPNFRKFTVNGTSVPTFTIRPGEVQRWRIVQAGVSWTMPFLIEGHDLNMIAFDGITLPSLVTKNSELLSPGNRMDVLIRGGSPGVYRIIKQANQQANPAFGPIANTPEVVLARLVVAGTPMNMSLPTTLPAPASLPTIKDSEITGRRTLVYATDFTGNGPSPQFPDNFTIDGKRFDPDRVDQLVKLGAVEEWTLTNPMADTEHPFHIHINPFQVVSVNGVAVTPRWQDTVNLPFSGKVVMRTRFEDFTGLFVNHCHFLAHEDQGMMQTVSVV